jgi:2-C-methyl-D-erythritol 4-phosphate cytidylyltransferase
MRYVIIVAGGKGLRMGSDVPKQFLPIAGRPVLMRTIDAFRNYDPLLNIILVLPARQHTYWKRLCKEYSFKVPCEVVSGGETRFDSVKNGLAVIPDGEQGEVAVHDGVRPFVAQTVIARCFEEAANTGTAVPIVPVVETLRRLQEGVDSVTVPRKDYRLVQTPQTFDLLLLKHAYRQPYKAAFTDDASVVEAMGIQISLVDGNRENIKITTPFDLIVGTALAQSEDQEKQSDK